ncbi:MULTISPECIES: class I SAM-dependent methyltransferase family protein [Archaeoglobus]|jgi:tRNA wybutosine-synthesizing protein 2|nr:MULTISPECIES: class I SAM-dependent methyltransferase family protein [Archaeoglobus]AIG98964.1 putative methyltransferase [Archaeoglobus fulgidus DSM 8774]MDI3497793.1 tRNA wybutosine-synthesizing protein 2 [Archaeoglobus sp.]
MKAVRVPKSEAEQVRRLAEKLGVKDKSRRITATGDYVEIPIIDSAESFFKGYTIVEQDNPVFSRKRSLREILRGKVPEELIPTNYKVIGDIVVVKLDERAREYAKVIGEALMQINPCKAVWCDYGRYGMKRKPRMELIAGEGSVTEHRENGCRFRIDVAKVMFSLGNQAERMRIARLVEDGEVVVDMFAGIGYFSIPIAVHSKARRIYSIEINPESYKLLLENIKLNDVGNIVPILGDSQFVTPEGVADRVVMGHIYCHDYLHTAIRALKERGVVHYHEATPEAVIDRPVRRVEKACRKMGKKCRILGFKKVKNYSPGVYHVVVDAEVY